MTEDGILDFLRLSTLSEDVMDERKTVAVESFEFGNADCRE